MASSQFAKLCEPGKIGSLKTRNRIIKSGAGLFMWHEDETHMNARMLAFYEGIARGGVGLLVVEAPTIDYPAGARWRQRYRIDDDKFIGGLAELTAVIHKHGCPTFMQMNHDGSWQTKLWDPVPVFAGPPIAASPVKLESEMDSNNELPRELAISEIEEIVDKFASAAVRAEKAGFDGVDVNAGSSHLLHTFLSPYWNKRTDIYGGTTENRARFLVQIIQEIKKRLGKDFPVSVLINGLEVGTIIGVGNDQCLTPEESRQIAPLLEKAGADAICLRNHWLGYHLGGFLPDQLFMPESRVAMNEFPKEYDFSHRGAGANTYITAALKKVVNIPVIAVGRYDAVMGEKLLEEGKADFIAMTRRLMADYNYPNKIAAGKLDDVAPCTACNSCLGTGRCRINAFINTEDNEIKKAEKKKKVAVIGGGPAGMEAARVAALRGHDVTLYEKSSGLGGLLPLAALIKGTEIENIPAIVKYLKRQLAELGVKVELGQEMTQSKIDALKPDAIIVATGGIISVPEIKGKNKTKVLTSSGLHRMVNPYLKLFGPNCLNKLTKLWLPVGKKVVVIGADMHGCEIAEFLLKRNRKVTMVDTSDNLGDGMVDASKPYLFSWFKRKGLEIFTGARDIEITESGVSFVSKEGTKQNVAADTVIATSPIKPDNALFETLKGKSAEVYMVGDCGKPGLIIDAVAEASCIGRSI